MWKKAVRESFLQRSAYDFLRFWKAQGMMKTKPLQNASLIHDDVQILNQGQHKNFSAKVAGISMPFTTLDEFL